MRSASSAWLAGAVLVGALAGAAARVSGQDIAAPLPADAIARVGDTTIARAEYLRALTLLQAERRTPVGESDRRLALERLVEEELLLQAALRADRVRGDAGVTAALVDAVLEPVLSAAEAAEPAEPTATLAARRLAARARAFQEFTAGLRAQARVRREGSP